MDKAQLERIQFAHFKTNSGRCANCRNDWPCITSRLVNEVVAEQSENSSLRNKLAEAQQLITSAVHLFEVVQHLQPYESMSLHSKREPDCAYCQAMIERIL